MKSKLAGSKNHNKRSVVRLSISVVGAGAVGSALVLALSEAGCNIVSIVSRSGKPALVLAKATRCKKVSTSVADISRDTELLLLAVPDNDLEEIVRQIAKKSKLKWKQVLVVHTSGINSIDVLKPLERLGARVAALHPIQSFPKTKSLRERAKSTRGIYFGAEGNRKNLEGLAQLVALLGSRSIEIPAGAKALYHAACVFASNYVVALLNAVDEAATAGGFAGHWKEMMLPLFTTTVENALKTSPAGALTGPIVRNDLETVERHLDALKKYAPQLIPFYSMAGIEVGRVARRRGDLSPEQFQELIDTIRRHVRRMGSPKKKN